MRRTLPTRTDRALFAAIVAVASLMFFSVIGGVGIAGNSIAAAQYQYDKVTICHVTGSGSVTITVAASAVAAHRKHGDVIGFCPA